MIESLERAQLRRVPAFQAGDRVRVHFQVVEGTRRRTFPLHSPKIERIEVAARGDVRRAKLYYLRERVGRRARVRERRWTGAQEAAVVEGAMPADDAPRPGEEELAEAEEAEAAAAEDGAATPPETAAPADDAAPSEAAAAPAADDAAPSEAAAAPAADDAAPPAAADAAPQDQPAEEPGEQSAG